RVRGSRVPDVMVISPAVLEAFQTLPDWEDIPLAGVPFFVAEVLSPNDRHSEVVRDVNGYLRDGVKLILGLDPVKQTIVVYTPGDETLVLKADDTVSGGYVLPGFSAPVGTFFAIK